MKRFFLLLLTSVQIFSHAQEMDSDLYAVLNNNSLAIFMKTLYTTMNVVTYRASNQLGLVEEHTTTYKKGKINPERINFTTVYTEFFILEDRKKSIGKYEINERNEICRYERTDFNNRNLRTFTYYHYFTFDQSVVKREFIRIKEYVGTGSVEVDTVVTLDSVLYTVDVVGQTIVQKDISEGGSTTTYILEGNKLIKKTCALTGFAEEDTYSYDAKGQLASIETALIGEDGQRITNLTRIHYSLDGLITEVIFEDQTGEVLEKKIFTYK